VCELHRSRRIHLGLCRPLADEKVAPTSPTSSSVSAFSWPSHPADLFEQIHGTDQCTENSCGNVETRQGRSSYRRQRWPLAAAWGYALLVSQTFCKPAVSSWI